MSKSRPGRVTGRTAPAPAFLKDGFAAASAVRMLGSTIEGPLTRTGAILKRGSDEPLAVDHCDASHGALIVDHATFFL